jgi:hypothetical protein
LDRKNKCKNIAQHRKSDAASVQIELAAHRALPWYMWGQDDSNP